MSLIELDPLVAVGVRRLERGDGCSLCLVSSSGFRSPAPARGVWSSVW